MSKKKESGDLVSEVKHLRRDSLFLKRAFGFAFVSLVLMLVFASYLQVYYHEAILLSPEDGSTSIPVQRVDSFDEEPLEEETSTSSFPIYTLLTVIVFAIVVILAVIVVVYFKQKKTILARGKLHAGQFRLRGYDDKEIREAFRAEGWKESYIDEFLKI